MTNDHFTDEKSKEELILISAVRAAGKAILSLSGKNNITLKNINHSPLTTADIQANQILKKQLLEHFPEYGWLSEETDDNSIRLSKKRVWIVDPLDGTKEYINNIPEFAVSVALVEDGIPIISTIFNPVTEDFFYASKGSGAWLNNKRIYCDHPFSHQVDVLASRSEMNTGNWQRFTDRFNVRPMGSIAYKLALIAAGKAHATFSLQGRSEWDIAAGVLLVQEAGGIVHDLSGKSFMFNQSNTRINGIIACSKTAYSTLMKQLKPEL